MPDIFFKSVLKWKKSNKDNAMSKTRNEKRMRNGEERRSGSPHSSCSVAAAKKKKEKKKTKRERRRTKMSLVLSALCVFLLVFHGK